MLNLANVIREAFDKSRARADEKEIVLESFVDGSLQVESNRDALGHIFGNLVENAIKYSQSGGMVSIRATPLEGGRALVEVIDVGYGIEPGLHERIFERFPKITWTGKQTISPNALVHAISSLQVNLYGPNGKRPKKVAVNGLKK